MEKGTIVDVQHALSIDCTDMQQKIQAAFSEIKSTGGRGLHWWLMDLAGLK